MSNVQRLRPSFWAPALALALALVGLQGLVLPAQAAQFCGPFDTVNVNNKQYVIQNNVWGASTPQCIEATTTSTSFTVTSSGHNNTGGTPASYPSVFRGCHWGNCTNGGGLPLRVDNIGSATTSWSITTPGSGAWNAAYDLWFNSTPTSSPTQAPDHAELMVWLNWRGGVSPAGSIIASNVSVAGATWNLWTTQFSGWRYIAYQRTQTTNSVSNLDLRAIINDARNRGLVSPTSYFIGAETGFEIWQGGAGLVSGPFTFNATAGSGTTTSTSTSTTSTSTTTTTLPGTTTTTSSTTTSTTGPPGTCRVAYALSSVWGDGFVANLTVTNLGSSPITGWTVRWSFNNNAQITNIWNATRTQTGQAVAATNVSHNPTIGANGGSQGFGFQASYSGAAPTRPSTISLNNVNCTVV